MLIKSGDIFLMDILQSGINDHFMQRPVIILETICGEKVKALPLSSQTGIVRPNIINMSLLLNDRESYVSIVFDNVISISKDLIKTKIGEISSDAMKKIIKLVEKGMPAKQTCKRKSKSSDITIFNEDLDISDYIRNTNNKVNNLTSKKTFLVNVFVAIMTKIIASLITNIIWIFAAAPTK